MAKRSYKKKSKPVLPPIARRRIRYIMFRIKRDTIDTLDRDLRVHVGAIKNHFNKILEEAGLSWSGFTFSWDVSPSNPYEIVRNDLRDWVAQGGSFIGRPEGMTSEAWAIHVLRRMLQNQETPPVPLDPPAFTKQV